MLGVAHFYYSRELPPRAVAIAKVKARPTTPADLVDIDSTPYLQGALTVAAYPSGAPVFEAPGLGVSIPVSGAQQYVLENQFFEITNVYDDSGVPLYYKHTLPRPVTVVQVRDLAGEVLTGHKIINGALYHDYDGRAAWVSYYEGGSFKTEVLRYDAALSRSNVSTPSTYTFSTGGILSVYTYGAYHLRFTEPNGYFVQAPYSVPLNDPWYVRIRFSLRPVPPEWGRQIFLPSAPYQLGTWIPGKVLDPHLLEFERKNIYFDGTYPDILVYDQNFNLKYALDGSLPESYPDKGFVFPWRRHQCLSLDKKHARVQVAVEIEPTDQVFGFYSYAEPDVVFQALDVNPFTNPAVKNRVVEIYYADRSSNLPPR